MKKRYVVFSSVLLVVIAFSSLNVTSKLKENLSSKAASFQLYGSNGTPVATGGPRVPSGWTLEPAGTQVQTQAQPSFAVLSPDGKNLYLPTNGQWDEDISVVNTSTLSEQNVPAASAYQGVAEDANGNMWLSGGGRDLVYQYKDNGNGTFTAPANSYNPAIPPLAMPTGISVPGYPGQMLMGNGWLYIASHLPIAQTSINSLDSGAGNCPSASDVLGSTSSGGQPSSCSVIVAMDVSNPSNTSPTRNLIPVGQDAYSLALSKTNNMLYVSNWADGANSGRAGGNGTVSIVKLSTSGGSGSEVQAVPVGDEPMGLALSPSGNEIAVANALSDTVSIISLNSAGLATSVKDVPVGLYSDGPIGAQPVDVNFSSDGTKLFVTLFGLNAVEVLNSNGTSIPETIKVGESGAAPFSTVVPLTLIPVGWMPISSVVGTDPVTGASRIYVANYQGMGTGPGFYFPASDTMGSTAVEGSVSVVDLPQSGTSTYSEWTATAISADDLLPLLDRNIVSAETSACADVSVPGGGVAYSNLICAASANQIPKSSLHVLVLLRENKTVDSMLGYLGGKLPGLWANSAYDTYGPMTTPNLAALATQFGIDDNSYVAGDESETGHSTLTGGETTPATELYVHTDNDFGLRGNRNGDPLGGIDHPKTRLADEILQAGLSERTYTGDLNPNSPANANDLPGAMWGNGSSPVFSGTNTDFPDTNRIQIFTKGSTIDEGWDQLGGQNPPAEFGKPVGLCGGPVSFCNYPGASASDYSKYSLAGWENSYASCRLSGSSDQVCQSAMPQLSILELPDDHTDVFNGGNNPVMWAPQVMVANNDLATGELVTSLSKSPFWKDTLVMIVEDDTQFTGDHINVLRSYVVTAGGLAKLLGPAGQVSHQVSSFCSVDKTIEDLFSLPSMSVCDATASPLDSLVANSLPASAPPTYQYVQPSVPVFLPYPTSPNSVQLKPWCATGSPTGIGYQGMLNYQSTECFGSYVGAVASTLNLP